MTQGIAQKFWSQIALKRYQVTSDLGELWHLIGTSLRTSQMYLNIIPTLRTLVSARLTNVFWLRSTSACILEWKVGSSLGPWGNIYSLGFAIFISHNPLKLVPPPGLLSLHTCLCNECLTLQLIHQLSLLPWPCGHLDISSYHVTNGGHCNPHINHEFTYTLENMSLLFIYPKPMES